eukprot:tig00000405_g446.t1
MVNADASGASWRIRHRKIDWNVSVAEEPAPVEAPVEGEEAPPPPPDPAAWTWANGEEWTKDSSLQYDITSLTGYEVVIESKSGNKLYTLEYRIFVHALQTTGVAIGVAQTAIADRAVYPLGINSTAMYFKVWVANSTGADKSFTHSESTWKPLRSPENRLVWKHNSGRGLYNLTFPASLAFGAKKIVIDFLLTGITYETEPGVPKNEPAHFYSQAAQPTAQSSSRLLVSNNSKAAFAFVSPPVDAVLNASEPIQYLYDLVGKPSGSGGKVDVRAVWVQSRTGVAANISIPGSEFSVDVIKPSLSCPSRLTRNYVASCSITANNIDIFPGDFSISYSASIISTNAKTLSFQMNETELYASSASNIKLYWNDSWMPSANTTLSLAASANVKILAVDQTASFCALALDATATNMRGVCSIVYQADSLGNRPPYANDFDIAYTPSSGVFGSLISGPSADSAGAYAVTISGKYAPDSSVQFNWKSALGQHPASETRTAFSVTFGKVPLVTMQCFPDAVSLVATQNTTVSCSIWALNASNPVSLEDLPSASVLPASAGLLGPIAKATCETNCSSTARAEGAAPEGGVYCSAPCSANATKFFSFAFNPNRAGNLGANRGATLRLPYDFNFIRNIDNTPRDAASSFISFLRANVTCTLVRVAAGGSTLCTMNAQQGVITSPENFVFTPSSPDLSVSDFQIVTTLNTSRV